MGNGKSASLQVVLKKIENIDVRLKKLEKERSLGVVRLSDKEMAELAKIEKEMGSGKEKTLKEIFG
ncbi:MAG: hypothetical protein Q7K34_04575 [archaeon]|nr:hypothetical protein [archaeon]